MTTKAQAERAIIENYAKARKILAEKGMFGETLDRKARKLALAMADISLPPGTPISQVTPKGWNVKGRQKNPAPRIGTKKPTRKSQVTGKAPSKRLVKRRKENKIEGYFPNPVEILNAHRSVHLPILVQTKGKTSRAWVDICAVRNLTYAKKIIDCLSKGSSMMWRAISE